MAVLMSRQPQRFDMLAPLGSEINEKQRKLGSAP